VHLSLPLPCFQEAPSGPFCDSSELFGLLLFVSQGNLNLLFGGSSEQLDSLELIWASIICDKEVWTLRWQFAGKGCYKVHRETGVFVLEIFVVICLRMNNTKPILFPEGKFWLTSLLRKKKAKRWFV
jgi:hypothetical protein